ncbi:MAG: hypothetical protein AB7K09_07510 [Planctomycetota bacterium]
MDSRDFCEHLLRRPDIPPTGDVITACEQLSVDYLHHLMVMHKYLQVYSDGSDLKKVHLLLFTRVLDGYVSAAHLLRLRNYNASLTEMRVVLETLNLMQWLAMCEPALALYMANDASAIRREFAPSRVRACAGTTPYDAVHRFLSSYASHPFYTGREFMLQVDLNAPGDIEPPKPAHYPALDAVGGSIVLLSYAHTTRALGCNFGLTPIVDQDREVLARMYREIDGFLIAVEKVMGEHRGIHKVIEDFRRSFPQLYDRRYEAQQNELQQQLARTRRHYAEGRLPFPPVIEHSRQTQTLSMTTGAAGSAVPRSALETSTGNLPAAPDNLVPPPPSGF